MAGDEVDRSEDDSPDAGSVGDRDRIGICCSGGGIRSAAFSLGALQSLDAAGVLRRARYLSAVSGGSYIASAYAVASRHSDPELLASGQRSPLHPRVRVRNHCSYLTDSATETLRLMPCAGRADGQPHLLRALLWTVARPLVLVYAWCSRG